MSYKDEQNPRKELLVRMLELFQFRILPYSFGGCKEHYLPQPASYSMIREKPYLCLIMLGADKPLRLVKAIEMRSDVRIYVSNFKGEVIVGHFTEGVVIGETRKAALSAAIQDVTWQPYLTLTLLHQNLEAYGGLRWEDAWLIDIWAPEQDIDLGNIVIDAARECKYPVH
jgi:hypothetical protein